MTNDVHTLRSLETIKMMNAANDKLIAQQHRDAFDAGLNMGSNGGVSF